MGNNNYARGAAFERKVKEYVEAQGWYAVRAAGSHGLTDVLAYRNGSALFIQCKTGKAKMSLKDRLSLAASAELFWADPYVAWPGAEGSILWGYVNKDGSLNLTERP